MILFPDTAHEILLLAQGAAFLRHSGTLILADLHLGKSATFRARGVPIPEGDDRRDIARIAEMAEQHQAREIIIAGDMFHAPAGITMELQAMLDGFLDGLGIPLHLVAGNHDRKISHLPAAIVSEPYIDRAQIRVIHDPADAADDSWRYLTGHWHPVVKIRDGKASALRLAAFLLRGNVLVLPAFGSFTGGAVIRPEKEDRIFVSLRDTVVEIPGASCG